MNRDTIDQYPRSVDLSARKPRRSSGCLRGMAYGVVVGILLLSFAVWRATDQQDEQSRLKTLPTIAATLNEPTAPPATTLTTSTTQPATEPPTTESPLPTDPPTTESPLETLTDAIRQATGNTNVTVKEFATLNVTLYFPLDAHLYAHTHRRQRPFK